MRMFTIIMPPNPYKAKSVPIVGFAWLQYLTVPTDAAQHCCPDCYARETRSVNHPDTGFKGAATNIACAVKTHKFIAART
jgi:hypothetical protein